MNQQIIKDALYSALALLSQEITCVDEPELSDDYLLVIAKIEEALKEFPGGQ
jgi:hypothetical protein